MPLSFLASASILWIALKSKDRIKVVAKELSNKSFAIYLIHMPIAGAINKLFSLFDCGYLVPLRALIAIAITWLALVIIQKISIKFNVYNAIKILIGLR